MAPYALDAPTGATKMTSLTENLQFKPAPALIKGDLRAYFSGTHELVCIRDNSNQELVVFDVAEMRALREWLDKVLP